jgi:ribosomal-protein-serine acetyltransferase
MFSHPLSPDVSVALLKPRYAEELFHLTQVNREHLREWLPWVDGVSTVEDTRAFIQTAQKQFCENGAFQNVILLRGQAVGAIGFHRIDLANRSVSIGYWLDKEHQGQGIMTASCRACISHAFTELKLNRVEIRCAVENRKSRAIPERLGFRFEGTLREAQWLYDHFVDHALYGLLAREWRLQAASGNSPSVAAITGGEVPD